MLVTIVDWEKYQVRSDRKNNSWFRLENKFFLNTFGWTPDQQLFFLYVCCTANQKNEMPFRLDIALASALLKKSESKISSDINSLLDIGVIKVSSETINDTSVTPGGGLHTYITDSTPQRTPPVSISQIDFENLYQDYPRKIGKSKGMAVCRKTIKTKEDLEALKKAIINYKSFAKNKEAEYIKYFSTFMAEWRDWVQPSRETKKVAFDFEPEGPRA